MKRWFNPDDMAALIEYARQIGKSLIDAQRKRWIADEQFDADRAKEDGEWCDD